MPPLFYDGPILCRISGSILSLCSHTGIHQTIHFAAKPILMICNSGSMFSLERMIQKQKKKTCLNKRQLSLFR